jgi:DNA-binding Lrp family transcriptional regulator
MTFHFDSIDRAIVQATQAGMPLVPQPYHTIAKQVGVSAEEVMHRMQAMLDQGVIRRIGAVPNHYALGWSANGMTVWDVVNQHVEACGEKIGALDFVSHCYRRPRRLPEWRYNLFAMVHGRSRDEVEAKTQQIADMLGKYCRAHAILYSTQILKKTGIRI